MSLIDHFFFLLGKRTTEERLDDAVTQIELKAEVEEYNVSNKRSTRFSRSLQLAENAEYEEADDEEKTAATAAYVFLLKASRPGGLQILPPDFNALDDKEVVLRGEEVKYGCAVKQSKINGAGKG